MYNESRKLEYINFKKHTNLEFEVLANRLFNRVSQKEMILEKDVCEFTINQILEFYKGLCSTSINSLNVITSLFRGYTSWCIDKGYVRDGQNHFGELDNNYFVSCMNESIKNSSIMTKDELYMLIEDLLNPSDKALMVALFEGICGKEMCELVNLTMDQFNDDGTVTLCTGRTLPVSKKLTDLCRESATTFEYYGNSGKRNKLKDVPNIFKPHMHNKNNINRKVIYNKLIKIKEYLEIPGLSSYTMMESGRIDYILSTKKETGEEDLKVLLEQSNKLNRYPHLYTYAQYITKYKNYLEA